MKPHSAAAHRAVAGAIQKGALLLQIWFQTRGIGNRPICNIDHTRASRKNPEWLALTEPEQRRSGLMKRHFTTVAQSKKQAVHPQDRAAEPKQLLRVISRLSWSVRHDQTFG